VLQGQTLTVYRVGFDLDKGHTILPEPRFTAELNHAQQLPPDEVSDLQSEINEAAA